MLKKVFAVMGFALALRLDDGPNAAEKSTKILGLIPSLFYFVAILALFIVIVSISICCGCLNNKPSSDAKDDK